MSTISWNDYFFELAELISSRSSCLRRQVGAVVVNSDHQIIATGYNGTLPGFKHCDELGGCLRINKNIPSGKEKDVCRAIHAEQNAIFQAAKLGTSLKGCALYTTLAPCDLCAKAIVAAGLKAVFYIVGYPNEETEYIFREAKIVFLSKEDLKIKEQIGKDLQNGGLIK